MDKKLKNISDNLILQIEECFKSTSDFKVISEQITNLLSASIPKVRDVAVAFMKRDYDDYSFAKDFIDTELKRLTHWKQNVFCALERYNTQVGKNNFQYVQFIIDFKPIINKELQYVYKNVQLLLATQENIDYDFVTHDSSCPVCKFLINNNNPQILSEHFEYDDCDSYLLPKVDFFNNTNLVSNSMRLYNVPTKYNKTIGTFCKLVLLKFEKYIKYGVKIKFVDCFEMDGVEQNILDVLSMVQDDDESYIKFDYNSYKHDLLSAMLKLDNVPDKVKELYYAKLSKNVIFPKDRFITFLAEQNVNLYYKENFIAYILNPQNLEKIDKEVFDLIDGGFRHV